MVLSVRLTAVPLLAACYVLPAPAQDTAQPDAAGQTILHLLDYVSVEYPQFVKGGKLVNPEEYAEQVEFAAQAERMVRALPADPKHDAYARQAAELLAMIRGKADGAKVSALSRELQRGLASTYHFPVAPKQAPELAAAGALYAGNCAVCHGPEGKGNGAQASGLDPAPSNFHEKQRQSLRSVYGLYGTITLGVEGTAMPAFSSLSTEDRWRLAFYVSQFSTTDAQRTRGASAWQRGEGRALFPDLSAVVNTTPVEASQQEGDAEAILAYLRSDPNQVDVNGRSPVAFSIEALGRSLAAYRDHRTEDSYRLAVTGYLEGFELVEASLDNRDHPLRMRTEAAMMAYRNAIKAGKPLAEAEALQRSAIGLLEDVERRMSGDAMSSPAADFVSSLVIILREGLETILVLAAMAAFLVRTERRSSLPWLHGGWVLALLLGGLTWVVSSRLIAISGAQRELTEGVTALIAAGLLLYVGFWLHSKANAVRWNEFIRGQVTTALSRGTLLGIGLVSFLAVYREVFETVLFYQAMWVASEGAGRRAILGGLAIGSILLLVVAWLFARFSVRLPLGLFFSLSSALLAVMAVVFAGQGIAALQEAGKLTASPVNIPRIPFLGIYPNMQGLALQVVLIAVIVAGFFYLRAPRRA